MCLNEHEHNINEAYCSHQYVGRTEIAESAVTLVIDASQHGQRVEDAETVDCAESKCIGKAMYEHESGQHYDEVEDNLNDSCIVEAKYVRHGESCA